MERLWVQSMDKKKLTEADIFPRHRQKPPRCPRGRIDHSKRQSRYLLRRLEIEQQYHGMTFEELHRRFRFYEALALYDAYYERAADLNDKYEILGDALDMAWVPLVFHCTYFEKLEGIFEDGELRPRDGKSYVALTELPVVELTRFRSLRPKPFEIAIGFPRALLESKGLFQPAYLKHATQEIKDSFKKAPPGYVELEDDLGAMHEVRVPCAVSIDDAVWVLTSKRKEGGKSVRHPGAQASPCCWHRNIILAPQPSGRNDSGARLSEGDSR